MPKPKLRVVFIDWDRAPGDRIWYKNFDNTTDAARATTEKHAVRVEQRKRGEWHDVGETGTLILIK